MEDYHSRQQSLVPLATTQAPPRSWPRKLGHHLWLHRFAFRRAMHKIGAGLSWLYARFPLPYRVKVITAELTYYAIEHCIVRSQGYQRWLQQGQSVMRLRQLFQVEKEFVPDDVWTEPTDMQWRALKQRYQQDSQTEQDDITIMAVIVPVYRGRVQTLRCLYQLLKTRNQTSFHLVVINDASPEAELVYELRELSRVGWFDYVEHQENQGFVRSVNDGMQRYEHCDIVILNADTEVYDGWLDRMAQALYHAEDIASVTPFSNNAELCSYPKTFASNAAPEDADFDELDALAASLPQHYPELPTGVGFCMGLSRRVLNEIGLFDAEHFGKGYGEENDWCLRAAKAGYRHVLVSNLFVRHAGNVSFGWQKRRLLKKALRKVNARHPHYRQQIRNFRSDDPLLPYRRQLDIARILQRCQHSAMLMVSHNAGGGTERHIRDLSFWLEKECVNVLRLSPDPLQPMSVRLWHPDIEDTPNLSFHLDEEQDELTDALKQLSVTHIHVHHLAGFPSRMVQCIMRLSRLLECHYDVTIHDYYFACPSINLIYNGSHYEKDPDEQVSQNWADQNPNAAGRIPIWQWREIHGQFLRQARCCITPSADTAERMQYFFPMCEFSVQPHPEVRLPGAQLLHIPDKRWPLRVAVIGILSRHKGQALLEAMAEDIRRRGLDVELHIFGDTESASKLRDSRHVVIHGRYRESEIAEQLKQARCHMVLIPSVWPETYSYTLSIALQMGLFPVCFYLGAPAERLEQLGWGHYMPRSWMKEPEKVNDCLLKLEIQPVHHQSLLTYKEDQYPSIIRDYYRFSNFNQDQVIRQFPLAQ